MLLMGVRVGAPFLRILKSSDIRLNLVYKGFDANVCPLLLFDVQQRTPTKGVYLGVR